MSKPWLQCMHRTLASLAVLVLVHQSYSTGVWQSSSGAVASGSLGRTLLGPALPASAVQSNALFGLMTALPQWAR